MKKMIKVLGIVSLGVAMLTGCPKDGKTAKTGKTKTAKTDAKTAKTDAKTAKTDAKTK